MMNALTNDDLFMQGLSFSCEQRRNTTEYHQRGDEFLRPSEVAITISNNILQIFLSGFSTDEYIISIIYLM